MSFNTAFVSSTKYLPLEPPLDLSVLNIQVLGSFFLINSAVSFVISTTINFSLLIKNSLTLLSQYDMIYWDNILNPQHKKNDST